jgi:DNA-binding XRE family transcriptional regulator
VPSERWSAQAPERVPVEVALGDRLGCIRADVARDSTDRLREPARVVGTTKLSPRGVLAHGRKAKQQRGRRGVVARRQRPVVLETSSVPRMPDGRARPRPEISKLNTRLAQRRLAARYTQKEMAALTGMSLATYRRLERAELENPPLRHLVNCMLVLRARIPDTRLGDVIEPRWLEWLSLHDRAPGPPPATPPPELRGELFAD